MLFVHFQESGIEIVKI